MNQDIGSQLRAYAIMSYVTVLKSYMEHLIQRLEKMSNERIVIGDAGLKELFKPVVETSCVFGESNQAVLTKIKKGDEKRMHNIEVFQAAKREAEGKIADIVQKFEIETGLRIRGIEVSDVEFTMSGELAKLGPCITLDVRL
jgi:hypothetical protein